MVSSSIIAEATKPSADPFGRISGISAHIPLTKALIPEKGPEGSEGLDFTFTFRAVGDGPPEAIRIRRMLKSALRCYGLRAKWAGSDIPGDTDSVKPAKSPVNHPNATDAASVGVGNDGPPEGRFLAALKRGRGNAR